MLRRIMRIVRRIEPLIDQIVCDVSQACQGADRVIAMTLHSPQTHGFFDVPLDHLTSLRVLVDLIKETDEALYIRIARKMLNHLCSIGIIEAQDMLREITAFILLNIGTKKEEQTIEKLFALEGVQEVHSVHGNVDILVKIGLTRDLLSSDAEIIGRFVQEKIRKIPGILSTQTLIPSISKKKS